MGAPLGRTSLIKIRNFQNYKGRKDVTHNTWFRCSNRLLEDPDFYEFSSDEILAWIYILGLSSQKNSDVVEVNFDHAERVCRIKKRFFQTALEKLKGKQIDPVDVTEALRERNVDDTQTCATRQDKTEQDITNNTIQDITISTVARERDAGGTAVWLSQDSFISEFIGKVPIKVQDGWLGTYGDEEWIIHQLREAVTWIHGNPAKAPRTAYAKFFSSWLGRAWEWKRKNNPRGNQSGSIADEIRRRGLANDA